MNKEKYIIGFKDQTGFRISKGQLDITTGKIVVNGIEITSVEDWEKVTKSLVDLQQRIDKATEYIKNVINIWETKPSEIATLDLEELLEILGGKE